MRIFANAAHVGVLFMNAAKSSLRTVAVLVSGVWIGGCAAPGERRAHPVVSQPAGHPMQCRMCYDVAVRVRTGPAKNRRYKVVQKHQCLDCNTQVLVSTEGGELKIKCARCAPEGVPCDRCLPPDVASGFPAHPGPPAATAPGDEAVLRPSHETLRAR